MIDGEEVAFQRGIEQFNREEFFAAHETWEAIWLAASGSDRVFLQGIIQLAAALHHWRGGNRPGALSLLRRGLDHLAGFPPSYRGIGVERLRRQAAECAEAITQDPVARPVRLPKISREPQAPPGGEQ